MSKILYIWELGAGYGHVAPFHAIAQRLKQRGHEIVFTLKNLEHADTLLGMDQFNYLQSPIRWPISKAMPAAYSFPGILKNAGFDDHSGLIGRVHAWLSLYRYIKPDLIVFDHAPTALLAARGINTPKALFGGGFVVPPHMSPLPCLHPILKLTEKDLLNSESEVVLIVNSVLHRLGVNPLKVLTDLFDVEENFLCTFDELDHYPQRMNAHYWGPSIYQDEGMEPRWPSVGNKKVFAYLNLSHPNLEIILQQLRSSPYSILVHIAGITPAFIQKHNGKTSNGLPDNRKLEIVAIPP